MKSLALVEVSDGKSGSVSNVAILNRAAIGSNSAQGGFPLSISTTVHPTLLKITVLNYIKLYVISHGIKFKINCSLLLIILKCLEPVEFF